MTLPYTGNQNIPAIAVADGTVQLCATMAMNDADISASGNTITLSIYGSYDGGNTYQLLANGQYQTGADAINFVTGDPLAPLLYVTPQNMPDHFEAMVATAGDFSYDVILSCLDINGNVL